MQRTNIETTTYKAGEFFIDIQSDGAVYEAYIRHQSYGIKSLMFGVPQDSIKRVEFVQMVENLLPDYMRTYMEEFADDPTDLVMIKRG